ncbi:MAG: 50S ribosomal protein L35 [Candidatus Xenolissoclinum pacificiensis L6]|uniref:Large ribosomal subunit protein bL35 n=1 Tax=Candidatus Xenolissoclinum pacificiensis L6 TaxID=1401685 RepID=W2UZV1_9RICK|nr:MAG: 50S ribosomal protein L35 [Candidatus Xenolissoclinum pacificiensis L6]
MGKLKTKSGLKGRFKVTATGKVMATQSGKRHNLRKRSPRSSRGQKGFVRLGAHGTTLIKYLKNNRG